MTEKYKCHCVVDAEVKASQALRVEEVERTDYKDPLYLLISNSA